MVIIKADGGQWTALSQWSRPTGAWIFFSGFKAGMKDQTALCPRSPSQWCPSKTSRRPKLPSCCQTLWWSPPQMTGWEKSRCFSPRFDELRKNTVFLHMWKSIQKTFFLFLVLQYVFVSFLSRDNTYKFLMSICPHLEVGKAFYLDPYRRVMLPCFLSCMYCSWSTGRHCEPKTLALN